jgi:hypothetical protein
VSIANGQQPSPPHGAITIGTTGRVYGGWTGLQLGNDSSLERPNILNNAGIISTGEDGVAILLQGASNIIVNSGEIRGAGGIWGDNGQPGGGTFTLYNSGLIRASAGLALAGALFGTNHIVNTGTSSARSFLVTERTSTMAATALGRPKAAAIFFSSKATMSFMAEAHRRTFTVTRAMTTSMEAEVMTISWDEAGTTFFVEARETTSFGVNRASTSLPIPARLPITPFASRRTALTPSWIVARA